MDVESQIILNKFQPREYQWEFCNAFNEAIIKRKGDIRKFIIVWPRRAGKDICCFNLMVRAAIKKVGVYFLIYPTYSQGKKIVWDTITNEGMRFVDFVPKQLIKSTHTQELKITLINGSIIQILGSDNVDRLVGTSPQGILYSETALQSPDAYTFMRPSLAANDGFCIFESTPRGKNWFYDMYQIATYNPKEWYCSKLTLDETRHVPYEEIEKDKRDGLISDDLIQQEWFTSFDLGVEGAYYAKYIDRLKIKGQIGVVNYEPAFRVNTAFDIGIRDNTSIIFFQVIGANIHIINYYEKAKEGLEHYANVLHSMGYIYGKHFAPHDIAVKEWGSGLTRIEKAKQLGIEFTVAPNISIEDGIEACRSSFSKMWIDEKNCAGLIRCLENYRQEFDDKKKVYLPRPLHNWASHGADAFRYLVLSLPKTADGLSAEELEKRYLEAAYGSDIRLPYALRRDDELF